MEGVPGTYKEGRKGRSSSVGSPPAGEEDHALTGQKGKEKPFQGLKTSRQQQQERQPAVRREEQQQRRLQQHGSHPEGRDEQQQAAGRKTGPDQRQQEAGRRSGPDQRQQEAGRRTGPDQRQQEAGRKAGPGQRQHEQPLPKDKQQRKPLQQRPQDTLPPGYLTVPTRGASNEEQSGTVPHGLALTGSVAAPGECGVGCVQGGKTILDPTPGAPYAGIAPLHEEGPRGGAGAQPSNQKDTAEELQWETVKGKRKLLHSPTGNELGSTKKPNLNASIPTSAIGGQNATRPPPIMITSTDNFLKTAQQVRNITNKQASLVYSQKGGKIATTNMEDYNKCRNYLLEHKIPHYTFKSTPAIFKTVLRGFLPSVEEREIMELLQEEGIEVTSVQQMRKKAGNQELIPLPLHIIEAPLHEKGKLIQLTQLAGIRVRTEPYRRPIKPLQCYKCQQFGHHSSCCGQPERCVKCAGEHHSKQCPRSEEQNGTEQNIPLKCVNCGDAHTAGNRDCKTWQAELAKAAAKARAPTGKITSTSTGQRRQHRQEEHSIQKLPDLKLEWASRKKAQPAQNEVREEFPPLPQKTKAQQETNILWTRTQEAMEFASSLEFQGAISKLLIIKQKVQEHKNPKDRERAIIMALINLEASKPPTQPTFCTNRKPRKQAKPRSRKQSSIPSKQQEQPMEYDSSSEEEIDVEQCSDEHRGEEGNKEQAHARNHSPWRK